MVRLADLAPLLFFALVCVCLAQNNILLYVVSVFSRCCLIVLCSLGLSSRWGKLGVVMLFVGGAPAFLGSYFVSVPRPVWALSDVRASCECHWWVGVDHLFRGRCFGLC